MFKKTLKRMVIGLSLAVALLTATGCDEETTKAVAGVSMRTVTDGAPRLDGGDINPFVLSLDIPFYIR